MQLNSSQRQIRPITTRWCNKGGGGGAEGGQSPVGGFSDFRLCAQQKRKDKSIGRAFLISPAPQRLDRTRLRQMDKMARHKQCQRE